MIVEQPRLKRPEAGFWKAESESDTRFGGETSRHLALRWVSRLRYGFIAGEVALIAALALGLQISIPLLILTPVIAVQTLSNRILSVKRDRLGESAEHLVGALF